MKKTVFVLSVMILFVFGCKWFSIYPDVSNPCSENYVPGKYDPAMIAKLGPPPEGESKICQWFGDPREANLLFKIGSVNYYDKHREDAPKGKKICEEMLGILGKQNTYAGLADYALKKVGGINYIVFSDEINTIRTDKDPITAKDKWFFTYFFEKQKQVAEQFIALK